MTRRPSRELGALVATVLFVQVTSGCLSNEYVIPQGELQRLASLPPETRGDRVRVVQGVGERRGDAVQYVEYQDPGPDVNVELHLRSDGNWGQSYGPDHRAPSGSPGGGFRGTPPGTGSAGFRGTPPRAGGAGFRGAPVRPSSGGGGGGGLGGINFGGGGGGGGGGGDGAVAVLVVIAVVLVAVAAVATVALVAGEGSRYDGYVQVAPEQPLHVKMKGAPFGMTVDVPLASLTPDLAADAEEAKVMDDEGWGMRFLERERLNRKGGAFRFELGTSAFNYGLSHVVGPAANLQLGYFFGRRVGLLGEVGFAGGTDPTQTLTDTIVRHSLALELDVMPVELGRLHAGVFGKAGMALAASGLDDDWHDGAMGGGGALIELALTTRMALLVRAGANFSRLDPSGWSSAGTITGGISIY